MGCSVKDEEAMMKDTEYLMQQMSAVLSCSLIQQGRHIDTLPVGDPLPANLHPLICISMRPSLRELQRLKDQYVEAFYREIREAM